MRETQAGLHSWKADSLCYFSPAFVLLPVAAAWLISQSGYSDQLCHPSLVDTGVEVFFPPPGRAIRSLLRSWACHSIGP